MPDIRTCPPCNGRCNQGRECPAAGHSQLERHVPLPPGLTVDELQQRPARANGLTLAAAIVAGIALGVLLAHSAARAGWLP